MDLLQLLKLLVRQWVVVLLTLLTTAAAAIGLSGQVQPEYNADGSVVLLSSVRPDGAVSALNPWERFGTSQQVAAQALLSVMRSEAFDRRAAAAGITDEFDVLISPTGGGAIIDLSVKGKDNQAVVAELSLLKDALQKELAGLQERSGAPPNSWLTADVLSFPLEATVLTGSKKRAIAGIGLLGTAIAVGLALISDGHVSRRPRPQRRERAHVQGMTSAGVVPDAVPAMPVARSQDPPPRNGQQTAERDVFREAPAAREAAGLEFVAVRQAGPREVGGPETVARQSSTEARGDPRGGAHPYVVGSRRHVDNGTDAVDAHPADVPPDDTHPDRDACQDRSKHQR